MDADVALIHWPQEQAKRAEFVVARRPRLLLVESGPAPLSVSLIEDWIRIPATEADLEARVETLRRRSQHLAVVGDLYQEFPVPVLEESGILRFGAGWVSLSPLEARLVDALLARVGAVVTRQTLTEAGWPSVEGARADPHRNVLDAHILRLRHRLPSVGLTIRTVRSRGYLLEKAGSAGL